MWLDRGVPTQASVPKPIRVLQHKARRMILSAKSGQWPSLW